MKKCMRIVLAMSVLLMAAGLPAYAHGGHGHVGVGVYVGPGWWGWPYPYYYPPYPYYYQPPVIPEQQPNAYIYQAPQNEEEEEPYYWYFCNDPEGYYPQVEKCPKGWLKVVPPDNPEDGEEE